MFGWLRKGVKVARKSSVLSGAMTDAWKGQKLTDDAGEFLAKVSNDGKTVRVGKNATLWKGNKVVKTGPNEWVRWTDDMMIVPKLSDEVVSSRSASLLSMAQKIPIPAGKTTFRLGIFAVVGYTTWRMLNIVGTISDVAEETINNFFGINCDESDTGCQEQGAKNMLMTGVVVAAIGVGGIMLMVRKPKAQVVKVVSDTGAAA